MADFSVGEAVGAGFGLIRRQPLSVIVWGFVLLIMQLLVMMNFGPLYSAMATQVLTNPAAGPAGILATEGQFPQALAIGNLLSFLQLFVGGIIYCAVFRAVLRPDAPGVAYLRLGMAELFLFVFIFGLIVAMFFGAFIGALIVAAVVGILAVAHAGVAAAILGVMSVVALVWLIVWLALRLSLVGPMIVADNKFHLFDAWRLTRGKAGKLFGVGALVFLILLAAEIVVGLVLLAIGLTALSSYAGGLQNITALVRQQGPGILSQAVPWLIGFAVVTAPLLGCVYAITAAPWARVYRDLSGPDVAETFS